MVRRLDPSEQALLPLVAFGILCVLVFIVGTAFEGQTILTWGGVLFLLTLIAMGGYLLSRW